MHAFINLTNIVNVLMRCSTGFYQHRKCAFSKIIFTQSSRIFVIIVHFFRHLFYRLWMNYNSALVKFIKLFNINILQILKNFYVVYHLQWECKSLKIQYFNSFFHLFHRFHYNILVNINFKIQYECINYNLIVSFLFHYYCIVRN